jgi:hypothetical protein|tara:strand:+ start:125 stop:418 length:294 start_codon:yes stop_codon:yes gene_type:complete
MIPTVAGFISKASMNATSMIRTKGWLNAAYSHSKVQAYTVNGGTVLYIIGDDDIGHAVMVNATLNQASQVTRVRLSDPVPAAWRFVNSDTLRECGAL